MPGRRMSGAALLAWAAVGGALASAQEPAPPAWLDRPLAAWTTPGESVPSAPPAAEPRDNLVVRCDFRVPSPTDAEHAVDQAGWLPFRYLDRQTRSHGIEIVGGLTAADGMCRPLAFNVFVFVGGRFAGAISPTPMDSRTDGVSGPVRVLGAGTLTVEYARYAGADALCCPSSRVTVTFEVDRSGPAPVINPAGIRTTRGS